MVIDLRLKEYLEYVELARNLSPLTINQYKFVIGKFCQRFTTKEVSQLSFYELEDWMIEQGEQPSAKGKPKAPSTINTERAIIRGFLRYCRNSGDELQFDPAHLTNMKTKTKRKQALQPEEIIRVANTIPYDKFRLCTLVMFFAGLRVGEVIRLRVRHVDGRTLLIEDSKSQEPRPAFIPKDLADELHEYIRINKYQSSDRIFPYGTQIKSLRYERYSTSGIRTLIIRHFSRELGKHVKPHDLRHAFASMLHRNGADIFTIKEFLGHSDVRTTQTYIHMENHELKQKHDKFVIKY